MTAVGVAVILAVIIAAMVHLKVARVTVVAVCVLFGLVLGVTPIGDGLNAGLAFVGFAEAPFGPASAGDVEADAGEDELAAVGGRADAGDAVIELALSPTQRTNPLPTACGRCRASSVTPSPL